MAQAGEIVIRSEDGTEHVFPAGFDPKKAASIVRGGSAPATAEPSDALALHMGERPTGGYTVTDSDSPSPLQDALRPLAHPKEVGDLLGLLIPNTAGLGQSAYVAYTSAAKRAADRIKKWNRFPVEMAKVLYEDAFETPLAAASRKLMGSGVVERYGPVSRTSSAAVSEVAAAADVERFKTVVQNLSPSDLSRLRKEGSPKLQDVLVKTLEEIKNAPTSSNPAVAGVVKPLTGIAERGRVSPTQTVPGMVATLPDKWGVTTIARPDELKAMQSAVAQGTPAAQAAMHLAQGNTSRYAALMNLYLKAAK